jgi:hypothetical protein
MWFDYLTTHTSLSLISQPQVIQFTSYLPMVIGSLPVLRLLPPTKTGRHDIADILLKVALSTINQSINQTIQNERYTIKIKYFINTYMTFTF